MTLHDLFQVRDALQLLCDKGYELKDMLDEVQDEIEKTIKWRTYERV